MTKSSAYTTTRARNASPRPVSRQCYVDVGEQWARNTALRGAARVALAATHAPAAFPIYPEGRHPHCHFRGLLRLYSRYSPPNRSAALRRPLSRGSDPSGCPAEPLVSYRTNRQLSGWNLPPLMVRAFGAHG